jgi:hypothetical protein
MGYGCAIVDMVADIWNGMPGMAHSGSARAENFITGTTLRIDGGPSNVRPSMILAPRAAGAVAPAFNGFHLAKTPKVLQD